MVLFLLNQIKSISICQNIKGLSTQVWVDSKKDNIDLVLCFYIEAEIKSNF